MTPLTELNEKGYCKIERAFSTEVVAKTLECIRRLDREIVRPPTDSTPFLNRGHNLIYNLQSYDPFFLRLYLQQEEIYSLLLEQLNDTWYKQIPANQPNFILRSLLARTGGPESLPLHLDSFIPSGGSFCWSMQVSIVLENQTVENGCLVVVPGSHRSDRYADPSARSKTFAVLAEPGDAILWDSRIWHGTNGNLSSSTRWAVIATFTRWWIKQNYNIPGSLPKEIFEKLNDREKSVLGFCSIPPFNEYERIDAKGGYSDIKLQ